MSITTVICDFDGVIAHTPHLHHDALNEALIKNNCAPIAKEDYEKFNGLPTKVKLAMLRDSGVVKTEQFAQIEADKQFSTIELYKKHLKRDDKIFSMLNTLKNMGYKTALATNAIEETTLVALEQMQIKQFFDIIVTTNQVKKGKPAPDIYETALKLSATKPATAIVFEDSLKGVAAAKAAGITQIVQVNSPFDMSPSFVLTKIREFSILR